MDDKQLLQAMKEMISEELKDVKKDMKEMISEELKDVREDIKELKGDVKKLETRVTSIEMTIENKVNKNIQLLAEGHQSLAERLGNLPEEVEKIRESTEFLDFMQKQMVEKLKKTNK